MSSSAGSVMDNWGPIRKTLREDPELMRRYKREWIARRRKQWFAENGPCRQCGSSDRLELDHIDPALKVHHAIWSWSEARRTAELAKCQVLCRECHLKKTKASFGERRHGTLVMYQKGRCRCDLCRKARSDRHFREKGEGRDQRRSHRRGARRATPSAEMTQLQLALPTA